MVHLTDNDLKAIEIIKDKKLQCSFAESHVAITNPWDGVRPCCQFKKEEGNAPSMKNFNTFQDIINDKHRKELFE